MILEENSAPAIFSVNTLTNYSSSDYNGFRPNQGAPYSFAWNSPPATVRADYSSLLGGAAAGGGRAGGAPPAGAGNRGAAPAAPATVAPAAPARGGRGGTNETRQFPTLAAYGEATGQDRHSVLVDYDIFVNVPKLDAQDRTTVQKVYAPDQFDFNLKAGSAAVDRGVPIPNITDGFTGQAPDLGALEVGQPAPIYGPRP